MSSRRSEPLGGAAPREGAAPSPTGALAEVLATLTHGDLDIEGRLVDASNATLVATCALPGDTSAPGRTSSDTSPSDTAPGRTLRCVYKPVAGERPLWDFPDGTLGRREVAAYTVSAASGWDVVPPTVWREDGPFGPGMCQLWVETAEDGGDDLVDIVRPEAVTPGWHRVLEAFDHEGHPVVLVHADHPALLAMAAFDVVINNADRKGGHVLVAPDGAVRGVDHGVAFNVENKLRTVLWGWAGQPLPESLRAELAALRTRLDADLGAELQTLLAPAEVTATRKRLDAFLERGTFPLPSEGWPSIPWPAF